MGLYSWGGREQGSWHNTRAAHPVSVGWQISTAQGTPNANATTEGCSPTNWRGGSSGRAAPACGAAAPLASRPSSQLLTLWSAWRAGERRAALRALRGKQPGEHHEACEEGRALSHSVRWADSLGPVWLPVEKRAGWRGCQAACSLPWLRLATLVPSRSPPSAGRSPQRSKYQ